MVAYELICAVRDLYEIYINLAPGGPHRLALFSDAATDPPPGPTAYAELLTRCDGLIRAVGCLLANQLAAFSGPLMAALWGDVRRLHAQVFGNRPRPPYFRFLDHETAHTQLAEDEAYRVFGEVLAVYVEVLARLLPEHDAGMLDRVSALGAVIAQTAVSSSPSTEGGD
jgi:hypothetical protein